MNRKNLTLASIALTCLAIPAAFAITAAPDAAPANLSVPATSITPPPPPVPLPRASATAADALFNDAEAVGETRALIVLRDGKPIFERYGPGYDADTRLISWSMAKTVTAVLVGMLVSDGRLDLDAPAPVPAWQRTGDPRGAITLRHLLHMSSGLDHVENGDPIWKSDTVAMLFGDGAADMAAMAEAKPPVAQPDEVYNYSSATSVILADIIARTLTDSSDPVVRRDTVIDFMRGRLIEPLGMTSLTPEFDAAGTMIGGSVMHATARDYAKFGEFLRNRGVADGQRHLPESWMTFMLSGSPADPGYGGHIWLNRPRAPGLGTALWPERGPNDLFACLGHQGQFIVVSPGQRLTVVRLGNSNDDQMPAVRARLADLMAAL